MTRLSIHLLGQLLVLLDGEPVTSFESDKVRALLAYLAVESDRPHRREALVGLLWPDRSEQAALNNLRGALSNLRSAIHDHVATPPFLLATRQAIQFNPESDHWLDVSALAPLAASREAACPVQALEEAVSLYRGPFLEGFTVRDSEIFEEWALLKREQIGRQIARACQQLVAHYEQAGAYDQALGHAWRWTELEPLDEAAHRHLMRLLGANRQRAAALAHYETLCCMLDEELGVEPSEETAELHRALLDGELGRPPPPVLPERDAAPRPIELPAQPTPFIGRRRELDQIAGLLSDPACRLLTLTGPGGVGKTRLAVQAACEAASGFPDGVFFVPLMPLTSAEFLVSAIAAALKLAFYGPLDPKVQLLNHLREMQALLVLDGFEHLLAGVGVLAGILEQAPHVMLLVTSRERLNLHGEWVDEVEGMNFPAEGVTARLEQYEAVQLFLQGARRVRPDFALSEAREPFVARICQLLLGMPLGIELAASWLRTLSTQQIVTELESGLEFLTSSLRDVPERHRSLWAAFDHSWKLLSEDEQAAFRRLSVFRGGFERSAAEHVAGASLSILSALVDKSLVHRSGSGRYEIHELLRQYAHNKLVDAGEAEAINRKHLDWFLKLAEQTHVELWGAADPARVQRLEAECDNLRVALEWSTTSGEAEEGLRLAVVLTWFWYVRADLSEGRHWLRRALEAGKDASPELRAVALSYSGNLAIAQRDLERGMALIEACLPACHDTGNFYEMGWALLHAGFAALQQGDFEQAAERYAESTGMFTRVGYDPGVATMLVYRGVLACHQGDYERARTFIQEGLPLLREVGDRVAVARGLLGLGLSAFHQDTLERAEGFFKEGLSLAREIGARLDMPPLLEGLAAVACRKNHHRQGCMLLGFSDQLRGAIGTPISIAERADYEAVMSAVHSNLGDKGFAEAWAEGQKMTMDQALRCALETV
jgi:predicted ATPase/DNA-binding SARP family transcriptional activator